MATPYQLARSLYERAFRKTLRNPQNSWIRARLILAYCRWLLGPAFSLNEGRGCHDLVCLVNFHIERGWVLEAICREIATRWRLSATLHCEDSRAPPARAYFLSHYSLIKPFFVNYPELAGRKIYAWYTHPSEIGVSQEELIFWLNQVTGVICTNSRFASMLVDQGVDRKRVTYLLGAADPMLFSGHVRAADGFVGFSSAYYPRKNPELVHELVRVMPHRRFLILGKGWDAYPRFTELMSLPNLTYVEPTDYADYPKHYKAMSVFVSPAKLEGGPIPLIETMMENIVPVASNTGFAPDVIEHGRNGFIFDTDASATEVANLVDAAFEIDTDLRASVLDYSWDAFASRLFDLTNRSWPGPGQGTGR